MITVTRQNMLDFIKVQPNDRPINFNEVYSDQSCGCLMVHYGKHANFDFDCVSSAFWLDTRKRIDNVAASFEEDESGNLISYTDFVPPGFISAGKFELTYGELKEHLKIT
jgi:hypothetical protein